MSAKALIPLVLLLFLIYLVQDQPVNAQGTKVRPSQDVTPQPSTENVAPIERKQEQAIAPDRSSPVQGPIITDDKKGFAVEPTGEITQSLQNSFCQFDAEKGPEMVVLPPGSFLMGSDDKTGSENERPAHVVTIDYAFALGRCEVTVAEFQLFAESAPDALANVAANGCFGLNESRTNSEANPDASWTDPQLQIVSMGPYPVVCVTVPMVEAYIAWINGLTDLVYRLPSEAELEYALHGGGADSSEWLFTDDQCRFANMADLSFSLFVKPAPKFSGITTCDDGFKTLAPVGSFLPNPFGLHDVYGNVWEWTADCWHDNFEGVPTDGSAWVENCMGADRRPLHGGSWSDVPLNLRAAIRVWSSAGLAGVNIGFRLARTLP